MLYIDNWGRLRDGRLVWQNPTTEMGYVIWPKAGGFTWRAAYDADGSCWDSEQAYPTERAALILLCAFHCRAVAVGHAIDAKRYADVHGITLDDLAASAARYA